MRIRHTETQSAPIRLLATFTRAEATGVLTLTGKMETVEVALHRGRILYARSGHSPRLGEALVARGLLAYEALTGILGIQKKKKQKQGLGAILLAFGLATREIIQEQILSTTRQVVEETLKWHHAEHTFATRPVKTRDMVHADGIPLEDLLLPPAHAS